MGGVMNSLYGPNHPGKLDSYLRHCIGILDGLPATARLPMFLTFRYDCINRFYPHPTFSSGEATLSFFPDTLAYVSGAVPIPAAKEEDRPFRANWLDWCRAHRAECAA